MRKSSKQSAPKTPFESKIPGEAIAQHAESQPRILTIGHSTRPIEDFVRMLQAHRVTCLVDVRTVPGSRRNPQFNKDSLADALNKAGLSYVHLPTLGGLRRAKPDSQNTGWRNASFRGYADYMQTPAFEQGLEEVLRLAEKDRIALMCAEAVPWRCHRSLIADALLVRGIEVEDIMSSTSHPRHKLTPFARVQGTSITYPKTEPSARSADFSPPHRPKTRQGLG